MVAKLDSEPGPLVEVPAVSNLDFGSAPVDIIAEITDTPMDFDWVREI